MLTSLANPTEALTKGSASMSCEPTLLTANIYGARPVALLFFPLAQTLLNGPGRRCGPDLRHPGNHPPEQGNADRTV
jgi:hypothetical protein